MNWNRFIYALIWFALSRGIAADSFYPLKIGNEWRYQSVLVEVIDGKLDTISIKTIVTKVIGDTLMPNGKLYFNVSGMDGGFRRVDSLNSKILEFNISRMPDSIIEYVLFDFSITDSISWIDGRENYITIRSSNLEKKVGYLNETSLEKSFVGAYLYPERRFSLGYGLSYFTHGCMLPMSQNTLIYAKVDGIEYSSSSIVKSKDVLPMEYNVHKIYPNPFNETAQITFTLKVGNRVTINVFNSIGQNVMSLFDGYLFSGSHKLRWTSYDLPSGLYIVKYEIGDMKIFRKCLLTR